MMRIGWFTTARGPGSYNLFRTFMDRVHSGDIQARLSFVFINRAIKGNEYRKRIIDMALQDGVPVIVFPSDDFMPDLRRTDIGAWREAYGKGLRERISRYPMDFGVLAGYMLIIDPQTCQEYNIINLHPALPDTYKGTWEEIVSMVVRNNDPSYGATVHICSPELDRGAIIAYDSFPTHAIMRRFSDPGERVAAIRAEEVEREAPLLMEAIRMVVEGRIVLKKGEVYTEEGGRMEGHLDLSSRVSEVVEEERTRRREG